MKKIDIPEKINFTVSIWDGHTFRDEEFATIYAAIMSVKRRNICRYGIIQEVSEYDGVICSHPVLRFGRMASQFQHLQWLPKIS